MSPWKFPESSDSRQNHEIPGRILFLVFLPKQTFLELTPPVSMDAYSWDQKDGNTFLNLKTNTNFAPCYEFEKMAMRTIRLSCGTCTIHSSQMYLPVSV